MNLRNRKSEKNKETLRRLAQKDGNKFCFDCGTRGPLYVVTNYHILVCSTCSAAHRSFQHKVKGISMSEFTDEEVVGVTVCGNDRAEKIWLASFKGDRPRPGHDRSIFSFVETVFERRMYRDTAALQQLEEDIKLEMHPELRKSAPPPPAPAAPPPAPPAPEPKAEQPAPPPSQPPQQPPQQPQAPPPPAVKQHDIFDDIFGAPAPVPGPPPQQPQQSQQQQQPWSQAPPSQPPPQQPWNAPSQPWGPPPSSSPYPSQPPQQPQPQWGAPNSSSAFAPPPQQTSAQPPQPQQSPQPSGPTSPAGGRIRVLGVTSTTNFKTTIDHQAHTSQPPQQPPQQPPHQPQPSWGAPAAISSSSSPYPQANPPPQMPPPMQQQPQPWGQPPMQQPQQYPPMGSYPYNNNYPHGSAPAPQFFQPQQADPWGSGAPMMMPPTQPQEQQKPAFDSNAFASLNPF